MMTCVVMLTRGLSHDLHMCVCVYVFLSLHFSVSHTHAYSHTHTNILSPSFSLSLLLLTISLAHTSFLSKTHALVDTHNTTDVKKAVRELANPLLDTR